MSPSGTSTCTLTPQCGVWCRSGPRLLGDQLMPRAGAQPRFADAPERVHTGGQQRGERGQLGPQPGGALVDGFTGAAAPGCSEARARRRSPSPPTRSAGGRARASSASVSPSGRSETGWTSSSSSSTASLNAFDREKCSSNVLLPYPVCPVGCRTNAATDRACARQPSKHAGAVRRLTRSRTATSPGGSALASCSTDPRISPGSRRQAQLAPGRRRDAPNRVRGRTTAAHAAAPARA